MCFGKCFVITGEIPREYGPEEIGGIMRHSQSAREGDSGRVVVFVLIAKDRRNLAMIEGITPCPTDEPRGQLDSAISKALVSVRVEDWCTLRLYDPRPQGAGQRRRSELAGFSRTKLPALSARRI